MPSTKTLILSLASFLSIAALVFGQEDKAVLTGIVTDSTQAAVPGATIEVANSANGFSRKSQSNETGSYTVGGLPIGIYQVTIMKQGFQAARFNSVQLLVGQIRTVSAQM